MTQFGQPPSGNDAPGERFGQGPAGPPPGYEPPQYPAGAGQSGPGGFSQGQFGQGQFGQGQYGQSGQGQSGQGQYAPGQYQGGEQFPPGQYQTPGQYQNPGQYPAPGQFQGPGQYPSAPPFQETAPGGARLAGWWRRVGATLIDGIITAAVAGILAAIIGGYSQYWLGAIIGAIYTTALLGARNRTVGNQALKTVTIRDDGSSAPIGYGTAFVRWLVQELLAITVIGGLLDVLWPLWDKRNQTLHDKAAKTLVIMA